MKYRSQPRHRRRAKRTHASNEPNTFTQPPAPVKKERKVTPEGVFATLHPEIEQALAEEGYQHPTPIQAEAIPPILEGRDMIGTAQTGTGKTAAFLLPILHRMQAEGMKIQSRNPQVVVLSPTRELAAQIGESLTTYGRHLGVRHALVTGGVSQLPQTKALERGVHVVVATPGRFLDLIRQRKMSIEQTGVFILDEVDRMLDMGFLPDIKAIIKDLPAKRQSLFFSATMSPQIENLAQSLTRDPVRVSITPDEPTVDRIDQSVRFVSQTNKDELLVSLIQEHNMNRVIVFTQMKHRANKVSEHLTKSGIRGAAIHGNKSQAARTSALRSFSEGKVRVLVATDVAARGIDVDGITHVVNYDLPIESENYVHRIGRTARAGASGTAISFCSGDDRNLLRNIERLIKSEITVVEDHPWHCEQSRQARGGDGPQRRGGRGGGGNRGRGGPRKGGFSRASATGGGKARSYGRRSGPGRSK